MGIEATRDRAAIRRAYAARLKETNPEDDPAGFQALRAAYEQALAYAAPERRVARFRKPDAVSVVETLARHDDPPANAADEIEASEAGRDGSRHWRPAGDPKGDETKRPPRQWRAPDPGPAARPRRPQRVWKPAESDFPPVIFDEAALGDYAQRRRALAELVAAGGPAPALQAALRALLAAPVLEEMSRLAEAEAWIAQLIAANAPRSDPLIAPAVAHFHWDESRVGPRSSLAVRVLARRDDLRFLEGARGVGGPYSGAPGALMRKPAGLRRAANRLTPGLGDKVRAFLDVVRTQRPGVLFSLDAEAAAWWDRYLAQPRLGPIAIWSLTFLPALFALFAWLGDRGAGGDVNDPPIVFAGCFGAIWAVVLVHLYGVAWPRTLWRRRWRQIAPAWLRYGWAPALAAILLFAAAIPPSPAVSLTLAAVAFLAALWAIAVGEPDRREPGQPAPAFRWRGPIISFPIAIVFYAAYWGLLRPGVRFSWRQRSLFAFAYLAVFWLAVSGEVATDAWAQMTGPVIAAAVGFVAGAGGLADAWSRRSERSRARWLAALTGLVAAALASLWLARDAPAARPLAVALIAVAVFAHKTPAGDLLGAAATVRDLVMRYGWLWLVWVVGNLADLRTNAVVALVVLGVLVLAAFVVLAQRAGRARPLRERMEAIGEAAFRYGWIALVPVLLVLGEAHGMMLLLAGGLWLLSGVGATVAGLEPVPWARRART